jgi:hypothetical protein
VFGSQILEVAIGLIFVYLVLSLFCSALREGLEGFMNTRAAFLERGIRELLGDPDGTALAGAVYNHPQVYGLFRGEYKPSLIKKNGLMPPGSKLPSYIPARNFALALLDITARGVHAREDAQAAHPSAPPISPGGLREGIANLHNLPVQRVVLSALEMARNDLERTRLNLEAWYDSAMDRVSGWYKHRTQLILFGLGTGLAVAINANSITLARRLYQDRSLREALVAQAEARARDTVPGSQSPREQLAELAGINLPLGWTGTTFGFPGQERRVKETVNGQTREVRVTLRWWDHFLSPLIGWLLTGLAITLGAPFWFDLLNKFMVIRATVKPHEKSPEEESEDRQAKPRDRRPPPEERPMAPMGPSPQTVPPTATETPEAVGPRVEPGPTEFTPQRWANGDPEEGDL